MSLQSFIPLAMKSSMFVSVFALGLEANSDDVTYLFRRPVELARALLAMNVFMPLFVVALALIFDFSPAVKTALVALAISPIPPLLPKKFPRSAAAGSYSIGLLIAAGLLAIFFVPAALEILEWVFKTPLQMSLASIAALVFMTILLPIGLGIAAHWLLPDLAERLAKPVSQIARIVLLACVAAILFSAAPAIWTLVGNGAIIALAAFVLVGLAIGHLLGGPEPENRTALAISTASRHPGMAVALAAANFPEQKLATAAVLLYLLVNALLSAPYRLWIRRRYPDVERRAV
jgi:BASS family bile acid:Na+ symporter